MSYSSGAAAYERNDRLSGLGDDDTLDGGRGIDTMIGGLGSDTYFVDNAADAVTEYGGQGIDEVRTSVSWRLTAGADVETLRTTDDAGLAVIHLTGNANGNEVRGNNGNSILNGGDGNDYLTGLGGEDQYLFNTALNAATNVDQITDFNVMDDTIRLDQGVFTTLAYGALAASQFVIGTAAQDATDRIIYNSNTGALFYDNDGVGGNAQVQFAELAQGLALTNFDFLVATGTQNAVGGEPFSIGEVANTDLPTDAGVTYTSAPTLEYVYIA